MVPRKGLHSRHAGLPAQGMCCCALASTPLVCHALGAEAMACALYLPEWCSFDNPEYHRALTYSVVLWISFVFRLPPHTNCICRSHWPILTGLKRPVSCGCCWRAQPRGSSTSALALLAAARPLSSREFAMRWTSCPIWQYSCMHILLSNERAAESSPAAFPACDGGLEAIPAVYALL